MTHQTLDPVDLLGNKVRAAIGAVAPEIGDDADPMISPSKRAELGDFQSNAAMPLAKRIGTKPRDLAAKLVGALDLTDPELGELCDPVTEDDIAGPGFINFRLKPDAITGLLGRLDSPELGLPAPDSPDTVVIDLCGVNLAKQMHVGHLRSTVIGDALARTFERLGAKVVRQNHVGDWGLPIAMVTRKLILEAEAGRVSMDALTLDELDRLYRLAQFECAGQGKGLAIVAKFKLGSKIEAELSAMHDEAMEHLTAAKQTLVELQRHDPKVEGVWRRIYDVTMGACLAACDRLRTRITEEASAGESSYAAELGKVVDDLAARGVATESDGALVVRLDAPEDGKIAEPCLIRKSDGGFLYATTDIAAIRRRVQDLGADRVIYTVDARQSLHFRQVFAASRKAGYATKPGADAPSVLEHAAFGTVLGDDGKPFKTRSGENVKLADLLDEAVDRATQAINARDDENKASGRAALPEELKPEIARAVGIAAIKYADLSSERIKDYVFNFDRMLAFEGNTGPYLLYALVRVKSVFRKAEQAGVALDHADAPIVIGHGAEKALALELLRYPSAVRSVADALEPMRLCAYLYALASAYSTFYDACKILKAESDELRRSRMRLADLTGRVLADGLGVLGLPIAEQM